MSEAQTRHLRLRCISRAAAVCSIDVAGRNRTDTSLDQSESIIECVMLRSGQWAASMGVFVVAGFPFGQAAWIEAVILEALTDSFRDNSDYREYYRTVCELGEHPRSETDGLIRLSLITSRLIPEFTLKNEVSLLG